MRRSAYIVLIITYCCLGLKTTVLAQIDPHFTQNYMYPMAVNPALTGTMDGSYRVSSIYRNQWANIITPYQTVGFSAEAVTTKNLNIGASFFKQTAGDSGYQYSLGNISLAYTGVRFGATGDQQISFGAQGGFVNSKYDLNNFQFGQQWLAGAGYVPEISSGETISNLSAFLPDISFGIAYLNKTPNKTISTFGGISVYHVTQPQFSFLGNSSNHKLPARLSAQAGLKITLNDAVFLVPNVIYNRQQNASEIVASTYAQLFINEDSDLMLGANIRIQDSVSPFIGVYFKGFNCRSKL